MKLFMAFGTVKDNLLYSSDRVKSHSLAAKTEK
jgi:hypothetical protein